MADQPSLVDVAAPLWSAQRVQRALGLDDATIADWRQSRRLLGLTAADDPTSEPAVFYPLTQFETVDGHVRVKPALAAFFAAAAGLDPWTVAVALRTPAPELDGLTPLDWAEQGRDADGLIRYAEDLTVEAHRR